MDELTVDTIVDGGIDDRLPISNSLQYKSCGIICWIIDVSESKSSCNNVRTIYTRLS